MAGGRRLSAAGSPRLAVGRPAAVVSAPTTAGEAASGATSTATPPSAGRCHPRRRLAPPLAGGLAVLTVLAALGAAALGTTRLVLRASCLRNAAGRTVVLGDDLPSCLAAGHVRELRRLPPGEALAYLLGPTERTRGRGGGALADAAREVLCRGSHEALRGVAAAVAARGAAAVGRWVLPPVDVRSACPTLSPSKEEEEEGKGPWQRMQAGLRRMFRIGKRNEESDAARRGGNKEDPVAGEDAAWLSAAATPLELVLTSWQERQVATTRHNFAARLQEEHEEGLDFDAKMEGVRYGGPPGPGAAPAFPWWHPAGGRDGGARLIASYLKIMGWPKDMKTKFPFNLQKCAGGECPVDFALANTLAFRKAYKPWLMTATAVSENKSGWIYVRGHSPTPYHPDASKAGFSLVWYRPARHPRASKIRDWEAYLRTLAHTIDTCVKDALIRSGGKVGKCSIVLDAVGFGVSMIPSLAATKKLLRMLQDHNPDRMGVFVIVNLGGASQTFVNIIWPFLPEEVKKKVHIVPRDTTVRLRMLRGLVEEEYIPASLGGPDEYEFDAEQYYTNSQYRAPIGTDEEGAEYMATMPQYG